MDSLVEMFLEDSVYSTDVVLFEMLPYVKFNTVGQWIRAIGKMLGLGNSHFYYYASWSEAVDLMSMPQGKASSNLLASMKRISYLHAQAFVRLIGGVPFESSEFGEVLFESLHVDFYQRDLILRLVLEMYESEEVNVLKYSVEEIDNLRLLVQNLIEFLALISSTSIDQQTAMVVFGESADSKVFFLRRLCVCIDVPVEEIQSLHKIFSSITSNFPSDMFEVFLIPCLDSIDCCSKSSSLFEMASSVVSKGRALLTPVQLQMLIELTVSRVTRANGSKQLDFMFDSEHLSSFTNLVESCESSCQVEFSVELLKTFQVIEMIHSTCCESFPSLTALGVEGNLTEPMKEAILISMSDIVLKRLESFQSPSIAINLISLLRLWNFSAFRNLDEYFSHVTATAVKLHVSVGVKIECKVFTEEAFRCWKIVVLLCLKFQFYGLVTELIIVDFGLHGRRSVCSELSQKNFSDCIPFDLGRVDEALDESQFIAAVLTNLPHSHRNEVSNFYSSCIIA